MRTYLSIFLILILSESGFSQEIRFGKEPKSIEKSAGPENPGWNDLDLVADMTSPMLRYANITEAFKTSLLLAEEPEEDHLNSSNIESRESLEPFDDHDDDTWTEIGLYGFLVGISGEAKIRNVSVDADVSFSDILSNLDIGGMALLEHRRGNWSFILDVAYLGVSGDTVARNRFASVELDAEFDQWVVEGFVGYRVFDRDYENTRLGIDVLGGVRYNHIGVDLDTKALLLGLPRSGSRNWSRDWVDGVVAARVRYGQEVGWGVSAWADIGEGADSSSYQLAGTLSYKFDNNIKVFAGYRYYHFEYERGRRGIDLDYSGPILGVSYRF